MSAALRAAHFSASLMADWACAHVRFASQTQEWNGIARAVSHLKRAVPCPTYFLGLSAEDMFSRMAVSA